MADNATKLAALPCDEFARALAARTPTPGGGGAAALAAALAVALCSMAGNFAAGKPASAGISDELESVLDEAESVRERLMELVDADAEAYGAFSRAQSFPKSDPLRPQVLQAAATQAAFVPIETMRQVARSVELLEQMETMASRFLISDVGCGAALAAAALSAASLNVYVNTAILTDRSAAAALDDEVGRLLSTFVPRADALRSRVAERIRKDA